MSQELQSYLVVMLVLSVVTFCVYGWDKRQAKLDRWRTPEKTLQGLALLGGWPGAILAQRYFRHKTRKTSFQIVFWLIVAVHVWILWLIVSGQGVPDWFPVVG